MDIGSSTPAIARTFLQGAKILDYFAVSDDTKEKCKERLWSLQEQLVRCVKERDALQCDIGEAVKTTPPRMEEGVVHIPGVPALQSRCEGFLQSAKMAVRDSARIAEPFYAETFDHRFHKFRAWAEVTLGADAHLTKCIAHWEPFAKRVVDWRNAVDHPSETPLLKLETTNFRLVERNRSLVLDPPSWNLAGQEPKAVVPSMSQIIDACIRMQEDILGQLFYSFRGSPLIEIFEIPENERDPACPFRLIVGLARQDAPPRKSPLLK